MLRSMLKGLGLTFWGIAAAGLLVAFVFVGYRVVIKYRSALTLSEQTAAVKEHASASPVGISRAATSTRPHSEPSPEDARQRAQAALKRGDCVSAKQWADKSVDTLGTGGTPVDPSLSQLDGCCQFTEQNPYVPLTPEQRLRLQKALDNFEAAQVNPGQAFLAVGKLYYGFGQFEAAIASLKRAIAKGNLRRPEDAYVYLGLSEQAIGDFEEARDAFARLQSVEDLSPRVLRLWTLYAETRLIPPTECRLSYRPARNSAQASEQ
jgi:tetratricopeptide (TPR) repeat protein